MAKAISPQVVTATRLRAGDVVYLAVDEGWVTDVSRAMVANTADELVSLESQAAKSVASQDVVAVYAIDVDMTAGTPKPTSVKERIRAAGGPTI